MPDRATGHCKLCEVEDFSEPTLRDLIRDVYRPDTSELAPRGDDYPHFPQGREERKHWEVAMTLRAFAALGALRPDAEILGVGAGREATIYWLTNRVRRVFATDLYLTEDSWSRGASGPTMLSDPGRYWHGPWNPWRLVVQHMNGLELRYDDESFDGVFSSGSIEHFGEFDDVRRSVEEIHRVLRPGGVATICTEYRLDGPPPGMPGTLLFDEADLRRLLLDGLTWTLASPLDTAISERTLAGAVPWDEVVADDQSNRPDRSRYPHIVLRDGEFTWTSVHVALVKPRRS